jgi:hypothetical protein
VACRCINDTAPAREACLGKRTDRHTIQKIEAPQIPGHGTKAFVPSWLPANTCVCRLPCDRKTGQPLFAKPNGSEAWVMLLEKAMAKFKARHNPKAPDRIARDWVGRACGWLVLGTQMQALAMIWGSARRGATPPWMGEARCGPWRCAARHTGRCVHAHAWERQSTRLVPVNSSHKQSWDSALAIAAKNHSLCVA